MYILEVAAESTTTNIVCIKVSDRAVALLCQPAKSINK